jgi:hypothetical protein
MEYFKDTTTIKLHTINDIAPITSSSIGGELNIVFITYKGDVPLKKPNKINSFSISLTYISPNMIPTERIVILRNKGKLRKGDTRPAVSPSSDKIIRGASAVSIVFSRRFSMPDL